MSLNPLVLMDVDEHGDPVALVELKKRLILYAAEPPGPRTAGRAYELFMRRFGAHVDGYRSTATGSEPDAWNDSTRARFEAIELPALRRNRDWGYFFGSERAENARSMMFHGSRPASEPGWASVFRFDFEWDFPAIEMVGFAAEIVSAIDCHWGSAGFVLCVDEGVDAVRADNQMYAWAHRYWGAEAQDIDATVRTALDGIAGVGWLTIVGSVLGARYPAAVAAAAQAAATSSQVRGHRLLQAEDAPRLLDRNRREPLGAYPAIARALLPLHSTQPCAFSGDLWDEDNTQRYLHRFAEPGRV